MSKKKKSKTEVQEIVVEKRTFLDRIFSFVLLWGLITSFGNFWYSMDGYENSLFKIDSLKEVVKIEYQGAKIIKDNWQYFSESELLIEMPDGERKNICLDSSIWFDYELEEC